MSYVIDDDPSADGFKDVLFARPSSVLVDSLTLQGAARLLSVEGEQQERGRRGMDQDTLHGSKWNYRLNESFRLAADFACLSQFLQSLVLHEKLVVDGSHVETWLNVEPSGKLTDLFRELTRECVLVGRVTRATRLRSLEEAAEKATRYEADRIFKEYLSMLSRGPAEGIFLQISNGYFGTGFSDYSLLPVQDTVSGHPRPHRLFRPSPEFLLGEDLLARARSESWPDVELVACGKLREFDQLLQRHAAKVDHALSRTRVEDTDRFEKSAASKDVLLNAFATFYYQELSMECGLPYLAHPLRSIFAAYDFTIEKNGRKLAGERIFAALAALRCKQVERGNGFLGNDVMQCRLPFVLSAVLEKAGKVEDIFEISMELRESPDARRFREWMTEVCDRTRLGRTTVGWLEKQRRQAEGILRGWKQVVAPESAGGPDLELEISLGVIGATKRFHIYNVRTPQHLRFFQSVGNLDHLPITLEPSVARVFGPAIAQSYARYERIVNHYHELPPEQRADAGSPLNVMQAWPNS